MHNMLKAMLLLPFLFVGSIQIALAVEEGKNDDYMPSLVTKTPFEGRMLAIKIVRKTIGTIQRDPNIKKEVRMKYQDDPELLMRAAELVAIEFKTIAIANNYWSSRAQARATLGGEFPTCALSVAQRVPSSTIIHVSCALSKIPYVGFSPVRLQEQVVQIKPATDSGPLKSYPTCGVHYHLYFTLSSDCKRCSYTRQLCFCRLQQCPMSASACS
jgi:hypothetical protein